MLFYVFNMLIKQLFNKIKKYLKFEIYYYTYK